MSTTQPRGNRWLFWLGVVLAGLLTGLVQLAPFFDDSEREPQDWQRVVALFARDRTLRRTCLASAVGLVVTACVFFQPALPPGGQDPNRLRRPPRPRGPGIAGA